MRTSHNVFFSNVFFYIVLQSAPEFSNHVVSTPVPSNILILCIKASMNLPFAKYDRV
jgi:hypothetical protein